MGRNCPYYRQRAEMSNGPLVESLAFGHGEVDECERRKSRRQAWL